ncbi:MAG: TetR/AcrR family transcriptional regulator [Bacteroidales bacterium]|nr:TetR/AcrR family transcriptional regulator [Bacteroidales bacterium]
MEKQNTEVRQEQIKQAVLDIIYTEGLKNLSTRNLAKHIGLSEGAIFRHFAKKQDITLAIVRDVQKDLIGELRSIAFSNFDPEDRLNQFLCHTVKYLLDNKGITMLMFSEASRNNDVVLKESLQQVFNSQKQLVSAIVLDGVAIGKWDGSIPVEYIADLYMGIPLSLNIELVLNQGKFQMDNFCQRMLVILLKILKK